MSKPTVASRLSQLRHAYDAGSRLVTILCALQELSGAFEQPPASLQVELFNNLHRKLIADVGTLGDALRSAIMYELTETALKVDSTDRLVCGHGGANAFDKIHRISNTAMARLCAALVTEEGTEPGTYVQSALSENNVDRVRNALLWLDVNELKRLEAAARQECIRTAERLESEASAAAGANMAGVRGTGAVASSEEDKGIPSAGGRKGTRPQARWLGGQKFQTGNEEPFLAALQEANVLAAAVQLGSPFDSEALVERSGVNDAARYLRNIASSENHPLSSYVHCPGGKGKGGYRHPFIACNASLSPAVLCCCNL